MPGALVQVLTRPGFGTGGAEAVSSSCWKVAPAAREDYDPLRDKSYRETALGPDVVAWLAWLELGGAAERTLDQYERDLSTLCLLYPSKGLAELTDLELGAAVRRFPPPSRRVRKAAFDSFYKWALRTRRIEKNPMGPPPYREAPPSALHRRLLRG
jgi:hypothetical protein